MAGIIARSTSGVVAPRCPICRSTDTVAWYPGEIGDPSEISFSYSFSPANNRTLPVWRCRTCSHAFCHPMPDDLLAHYHDVVDQEYLKHADSRRLAGEAALRHIRRWRPTGCLLDVGCATGDFLAVARDAGYAAEGLELSRWSSALARARGFTIYEETLAEHVARSPARYDVVTLWGVMEHFSDPAAEVERLLQLLKPGGVLAAWTVDVDSIVARLMGRRWWQWQGQHVQYYTTRSLRRLAETAGFETLETLRYPFAATLETITNSVRRYRTARLWQAVARPVFAVKRVWYLHLPGELFYLARRPGGGD